MKGRLLPPSRQSAGALSAALLLGFLHTQPVPAGARSHFEAPPPISLEAPPEDGWTENGMAPEAPLTAVGAQTEWVWHKSEDGSRPNHMEQQFVWLMNRARTLPKGEGRWLAVVGAAQSAIRYFDVDTAMLIAEFDALAGTPPAAFDRRLFEGARVHSEDLITRDAQDHTNQFQRVADAGFHHSGGRGSVFSYTRDAVYGHAGFNIDWGGGGAGGMQSGRGHRAGLMGNYPNIGVAVVEVEDTGKRVGPYVTTINYMKARTSYTDHHNNFILGTVWEDANGNGTYDPGEGLGGVEVRPAEGNFFAITGEAGGYAFPAGAGSYKVTFSGGKLGRREVKTLQKGSTSSRLDLVLRGGGCAVVPAPLPRLQDRGQTLGWDTRAGGLYQVYRYDFENGDWTAAGLPGFYGFGASLTFETSSGDTDSTYLLQVVAHE